MSKPILACDDQALMRKLVTGVVRHMGYEIVTAESGEECLETLKTVRPDLMILDVDMSGISGFETCKRIRETMPHVTCPVISLTGRRDKDDVKQALAAGGNDFLIKPFKPDMLEQRVEKWIGKKVA
jgi:CheY-like chemotaxis protein